MFMDPNSSRFAPHLRTLAISSLEYHPLDTSVKVLSFFVTVFFLYLMKRSYAKLSGPLGQWQMFLADGNCTYHKGFGQHKPDTDPGQSCMLGTA